MKRLLLLGAGRAHLQVLRAFAQAGPPAGAELLLVAPHGRRFEPARLPRWLAGHDNENECSTPLPTLAAAASCHFVEAAVVALDASARRATLGDGRVAEYEVLSLDLAEVQDREAIPGAREHALFVRPAEAFVALLPQLLALAAGRAMNLAVIGADAAVVQIALALQQRVGRESRVALVTGGGPPAAEAPPSLQRRLWRALARQRITVVQEACTRIDAGAVTLANGARLACDAPVVAGGLQPPPWLAASGLALQADGRVACGPTLQSLSHPDVFAGQGAQRALNLRRFVGGGELAASAGWLATLKDRLIRPSAGR